MTWTRSEERSTHPSDKPYCGSYPEPALDLWPATIDYLEGRGLNPYLARDNRWYPTRAIDGWGRLVIPCTSHQKGNLYWQARLLEPPCGPRSPVDKTLARQTGLDLPRRWESPHGVSRGDAVGVVWPWLSNGYGVVAEGPMDALACAAEGYRSVALLSATPSEACLGLTSALLRGIMTLVVMDCGAEDPMVFNAGWLRERGVPCRLVNPYPHKDIAACPEAKRGAFLGQQLPRTNHGSSS